MTRLVTLVLGSVVFTGISMSGHAAPPQKSKPVKREPVVTVIRGGTVFPPYRAVKEIGVNLAGAEFGSIAPSPGNPNVVYPGRNGTEYAYPTASELDYYKSRGLQIIRLPFRWERMQPKLNQPLNSAELHALDAVVDAAAQRGMFVLLDCHNYGRYTVLGADGKTTEYILGDAELPYAALADFWKRMAQHFAGKPSRFSLLGYGLMNEPHDMRSAQNWPRAAQAATDAIRTVDKVTAIFVAGDSWSGAHSWRNVNENLDIHDPSNNLVYEAHQYFDSNSSGTYTKSYEDEAKSPNFTPQIGVKRVEPFVTWCKEKHRRGFLGEFSVPGDNAGWLAILDNFLAYLNTNQMGGTYWAGGPRWPPGDKMALEWDGKAEPDRPQMIILKKYTVSLRPPKKN